jgi:hypothetical protein
MAAVVDVRAGAEGGVGGSRAGGGAGLPRILMEPTDFEYGERQYTAEDPAGHQWTFSETLTDVAPEDWGGQSISRD